MILKFKKGMETKLVDDDHYDIHKELISLGWICDDEIKSESGTASRYDGLELSEIKAIADERGIKYSPNIGISKLISRLEE